jgi:hypothetical protein
MRSIDNREAYFPEIAIRPLAREWEGMGNNPTHKHNNKEGSYAGGMVLLRNDKEQPASILHNDQPRPATAAANDQSTTSRNNDLPYFVIHVGPAKTSNKKLQREFTAWKDVLLQQDNYIYGGKFEVPLQLSLQVGPSSSPLPKIKLAPNMTSVHRALLLTSKCPFSWRLAQYKYNQKKRKRQRQNQMNHTNVTFASSNATTTNSTAAKRKLLALRIPPCWKALQKQLDSWQGHNVLLSDEEWSLRFFEFAATSSSSSSPGNTNTTSTITSSLGPQPIDWIYLLDALQGRWQVVVVVGYRYLYDWLPAALHQDLQWAPHKPKLNRWPGTEQGGGRDILPLMTSLLSDVRVVPPPNNNDVLVSNIGLHHSHIQHHHHKNNTITSSLASNNNSNIASSGAGRVVSYWDTLDLLKALHQVVIPHNNIDIRVFHIPSVAPSTTSSIRTSFFCNVLPQATHACHASQWMDDHPNNNATTTTTSQKEEEGRGREQRATRRQELYFDTLALAAAAHGLVDVTRLGRHDVSKAVQNYFYQDESIRPRQENLAPNSIFPLDCPSHEEYEVLLQGSLHRERQIRRMMTMMTNTIANTINVLTTTTATNCPSWNETHHVEYYWQAVRQDQFCWINTSAVLFGETIDLWKTLESLARNTTKKMAQKKEPTK